MRVTRYRKRKSGRFSGLLAVARTVVLATLACGTPPAATAIRIAHESDVLSLDPAAYAEAATTSVLSNIYEGLVAFDKEMRLVPALAVSWSVSDDRTWLIHLRQHVRFHDGRMLTASDVKFTLDRAHADPASGYKGQLSTVKEVEVVGEATVRLRTVGPDPLLLNRLAYILILPSGRPAGDYLTRPIGTGPTGLFVGRAGGSSKSRPLRTTGGAGHPSTMSSFSPSRTETGLSRP